MKHQKSLLAASIMLSLTSFTSQAALIDRGNGMIYDSDLNITWAADANLFKTQAASDPGLVSNLIDLTAGYDFIGSSVHYLTTSDFNTSTGAMTWWGAAVWVTSMCYGGYCDWRLPTTANHTGSIYNQTGSQMGHLFYNELGGSAHNFISANHNANYNLFINMQDYDYWSGTENVPDNKAWYFFLDGGGQGNNGSKDWQFYALAMRYGDVATVPVPAAVWLFGSALFGFMGWQRRGSINL